LRQGTRHIQADRGAAQKSQHQTANHALHSTSGMAPAGHPCKAGMLWPTPNDYSLLSYSVVEISSKAYDI
jgi:hypothetical protein